MPYSKSSRRVIEKKFFFDFPFLHKPLVSEQYGQDYEQDNRISIPQKRKLLRIFLRGTDGDFTSEFSAIVLACSVVVTRSDRSAQRFHGGRREDDGCADKKRRREEAPMRGGRWTMPQDECWGFMGSRWPDWVWVGGGEAVADMVEMNIKCRFWLARILTSIWPTKHALIIGGDFAYLCIVHFRSNASS